MRISDTISDLLRRASKLGWDQLQLAKRSGVSKQTVNRLAVAAACNGVPRRGFSVATIEKVEKAVEAEEAARTAELVRRHPQVALGTLEDLGLLPDGKAVA